MSAEYEASMLSLISSVRNKLFDESKNSSGSLYGIKQVKRGFLPTNTQFPVITLTPSSERVIKVTSDCKHVTKSIRLFIIAHGGESDDVKDIRKYGEAVHEKILSDYKPVNNDGVEMAYATDFTRMEYEERGMSAGMEIVFYCLESEPERTIASTVTDNASVNTVSDAIYSHLNAHRHTTLNGFSQILQEDWNRLKERAFPSLSVAVDDQVNIDRSSGREQTDMTFRFDVLSKVGSASDSILNKHLVLTDAVKGLIVGNASWGGACSDSQYTGISYGTTVVDEAMLYASQLELNASGRHTKPQSSAS